MTIKRCCKENIPSVKRFLAENCVNPVKSGPQDGNRTQAFEWHHCQWPWVTSKSDFKVTVLLNVK